MADIKLSFINQSSSHNNSSILIYQKNEVTTSHSLNVAWRVIKNCGQLYDHTYIFPNQSAATISDPDGNVSLRMTVTADDADEGVEDTSDDGLDLSRTPGQ